MPKELEDVTVELRHETEKAYLVSDGGKEPKWFPKSQCELERNRDGTFTLTAPVWLLKEKGFL